MLMGNPAAGEIMSYNCIKAIRVTFFPNMLAMIRGRTARDMRERGDQFFVGRNPTKGRIFEIFGMRIIPPPFFFDGGGFIP